MKLLIFLSITVLGFLGFQPTEIKTMTLKEANKQKIVQTKIEYAQNATHYGKSIHFTVLNVSNAPINITVPNGDIYEPLDSSYQNMVITEDVIFVLKAGEAKQMDVNAMCTEPHDKGASKGVTYTFSNTKNEKLSLLTKKLQELKAWDTEGQYAVWAMVDNTRGLESVYGADTLLSKQLREFLSPLTGKKLPDPKMMLEYNYNFYTPPIISKETIKGSFDYKYAVSKNISVGMFNTSGILVRELYKQDNAPAGFKQIAFQFDSKEYTDDVYNFYLIADGKIDLKLQIKPNEIRKKALEQGGQH